MVERIYVINLRKGFINVSRFKKAKRAIREIREFVKRHTKCKEVKIDPSVNLKVWERGIKKPPARIKVRVVFDENRRDVAEVYLAE